jgi:hypothetical protein
MQGRFDHAERVRDRVRLGDPVLDRYLKFVEAKGRHSTLLATASDLRAFFQNCREAAGGAGAGRCVRFRGRAALDQGVVVGRSAWPVGSAAVPEEVNALLGTLGKHRDTAMVEAMLLGGLRHRSTTCPGKPGKPFADLTNREPNSELRMKGFLLSRLRTQCRSGPLVL